MRRALCCVNTAIVARKIRVAQVSRRVCGSAIMRQVYSSTPNPFINQFALAAQEKMIEADLVTRGLPVNARRLFLFVWRQTHLRLQDGRRVCPGGVYHKVATIAQKLHVEPRTVQRLTRRLEQEGLLEVRPSDRDPRRPQLEPKKRKRGGSPTNLLIPHWTPAEEKPPVPERTQVSLDVEVNAIEENPVDRFAMEPDAAFVWPALSPCSTTNDHPGVSPQPPTPPAFEAGFAPANGYKETYSKSDQLLPGATVYAFESGDALLFFLIYHLKTYGVTEAHVRQWHVRYGLERLAQVSGWLFSDKQHTIQNPGGWMATRFRHPDWEAPTLVLKARAERRRKVLAHQRRLAAETADRVARSHAEQVSSTRESVWDRIADRLDELGDLYALAEQRARELTMTTDGEFCESAFRVVFRPGGLAWRNHLIDTALERPDLWNDSTGGVDAVAS